MRSIHALVTLCLLCLLCCVTGCQHEPAQQRQQADAPVRPAEAKVKRYVLLMPMEPGRANNDQAKMVWNALLDGVDEDPDSMALLERLYGDVPVEFLMHDGRDADGPAVGNDDKVVHLTVATALIEDTISTRSDHVLAEVNLHRVSKQEFHYRGKQQEGKTMIESLGDGMSAAAKARPNDFKALLLVANDYLLRHQPGWFVVERGFSADTATPPAREAAARRQQLDREIEAYLAARSPEGLQRVD